MAQQLELEIRNWKKNKWEDAETRDLEEEECGTKREEEISSGT